MNLFNTLQTSPPVFYFTLGVLGLIVGSFLNVIIYRLPKMLQNEWHRECRNLLEINAAEPGEEESYNLVLPRSRCPRCAHKITALENIPILSYILLAGKCSACKAAIPLRYPVIEFLSAVIAIFLAWRFGYSVQTILAIILSWSLLVLSMIDIDEQLLPDDITLPFLWLGLFANMFGVFTDIYSSLIGAMLGYGILWSVYMMFKLLTGKEGMGYGDFKLLAMLGAWLGWQVIPLIILLSSICGAVIGIGLIVLRKHDKSKPIPFGPYLALAGWIALVWGTELLGMYSRWAFNV